MSVAWGDLLVSSLLSFSQFAGRNPVDDCRKDAAAHERSQGLAEQTDGHH